MNAKIIGWKFKGKRDIFIISKYLPKMFINYKGKDNFAVEKLIPHYLEQAVKVSVSYGKTY